MKLPRRALTDVDLLKYVKKLKIPNFRGVFMRNDLPKSKPWKLECGILNLDNKDGPGTHWVAYSKKGKNISYFDSFGNLQPPQELVTYFDVGSIKYNHDRLQKWNTYNCGHLCIEFLARTYKIMG